LAPTPLGWEEAADLHTNRGMDVNRTVLFAIFCDFTTGEWRQYIPTGKNVVA